MTNDIIVGPKQLGKEIFDVKSGQVSIVVDDAKNGGIIALVCSTSGIAIFQKR